jgi:hypothetical protein
MVLGFVKLFALITKVEVATRLLCSLILIFVCMKDNESSLHVIYYANQRRLRITYHANLSMPRITYYANQRYVTYH